MRNLLRSAERTGRAERSPVHAGNENGRGCRGRRIPLVAYAVLVGLCSSIAQSASDPLGLAVRQYRLNGLNHRRIVPRTEKIADLKHELGRPRQPLVGSTVRGASA